MPFLHWLDEAGRQRSKEFPDEASARFEAAGLVDARIVASEGCAYCGKAMTKDGTRRIYCGRECKYLAGVRRELSGI